MAKFIRDNQLNEYSKEEENFIRIKPKKKRKFKDPDEYKNKSIKKP